jgi:hypothetical protein
LNCIDVGSSQVISYKMRYNDLVGFNENVSKMIKNHDNNIINKLTELLGPKRKFTADIENEEFFSKVGEIFEQACTHALKCDIGYYNYPYSTHECEEKYVLEFYKKFSRDMIENKFAENILNIEGKRVKKTKKSVRKPSSQKRENMFTPEERAAKKEQAMQLKQKK